METLNNILEIGIYFIYLSYEHGLIIQVGSKHSIKGEIEIKPRSK